jgi:hypothetical protein
MPATTSNARAKSRQVVFSISQAHPEQDRHRAVAFGYAQRCQLGVLLFVQIG